MHGMFSGCSSLTSLDLSNFNTSNVKDLSYMFYNCSSLTSLNLSNFNTNNVVNIMLIFWGLKKCCKIITNDNKLLDEIKYL
jgi:surface protein